MKNNPIAFMVYGSPGSQRNALTEEKYRNLAAHFNEKGFVVNSIIYHDTIAGDLEKELIKFSAILVWINPIEEGGDRKILDSLLSRLSERGCFVSAHPDTILKMGTKEILFKTKDAAFGGDIKLYNSFEEFRESFLKDSTGLRVLKQYRGNGGNGIFKIDTTQIRNDKIVVTHAKSGDTEKVMKIGEFFLSFESFFDDNSILIDQAWNPNLVNGMVRCYLSGRKVVGFGYQEINALYPSKNPGRRFYFSEDCGLFRDLRAIMENKWITEMQKTSGVDNERLPVIWDADFFINKINTENTAEKYSLCEINVSCVSPFPESSIPFIVEEVKRKAMRSNGQIPESN